MIKLENAQGGQHILTDQSVLDAYNCIQNLSLLYASIQVIIGSEITFCLSVYHTQASWCTRWDSNPQTHGPKPCGYALILLLMHILVRNIGLEPIRHYTKGF